MSGHIAFEKLPDGLIVRVRGDRPLAVAEWTSRGLPGTGALIRLRDDGGAVERDNGNALCVSWKSVAGLTSDELRYIGLPDAAPFALEVVANGAIHDPGFEISLWLHPGWPACPRRSARGGVAARGWRRFRAARSPVLHRRIH